MKRMFLLAVGLLHSASLVAPMEGGAASAPSAGPWKQTQQGLKNSKKMFQKMQQRDKKMREVREKGYAKRQLAMKRK